MLEIFDLSQKQVDNVKHVLFGNQRQSDVINEAVVKIVARGLLEVGSVSSLDSEDNVVMTIRDYLQNLVDNNQFGNETLVMLVSGEQSLANLKSVGPKVVTYDQPNPDSPKYAFRVIMLGQSENIDMSAMVSAYRQATNVVKADSNDDCPYEQDDDFPTRARKIKDAILPLVPNAVKSEIQDEYAQALCCAEYYYKNC